MTLLVRRACGAMIVATASLCASCEGSPAAPVPPAPPTVNAIALSGLPADLAVGETAQLRATATLSNGGTEDVTARAQWYSRTVSCVVSRTAVVTALEPGPCGVTAALTDKSAFAEVVVGPARTYTLHGYVRERHGFREPPVGGAVVEIAGGPQKGRNTTTDALGRFTFTAVPREPVQLRAAAEGFERATADVTPDASWVDILLEPIMKTLGYDSRQHAPGDVRMPFSVTHRGPVTLTTYSSGHECGTYETFGAFVYARGDQTTPLIGSYPCRPGVREVTTSRLEPGEYVFIVFRLFESAKINTAELIHPQ